ncbi:MAG TPA: hypothetical protein VJ812_13185 [Gemmatimonadaceae bacterium]|jgi:hypothetical protein|nr:hypothetical protein [Gemmatimonadaceae bacterium]
MSPAAVFEQFTRLPTLATAGMLVLLAGNAASAQITRTGTPLGTPTAVVTTNALREGALCPARHHTGFPSLG